MDHKVIVTNNHVLNSKEEASYAVARFHYEGRLPGADIRLKPDILFHTHKVSIPLTAYIKFCTNNNKLLFLSTFISLRFLITLLLVVKLIPLRIVFVLILLSLSKKKSQWMWEMIFSFSNTLKVTLRSLVMKRFLVLNDLMFITVLIQMLDLLVVLYWENLNWLLFILKAVICFNTIKEHFVARLSGI